VLRQRHARHFALSAVTIDSMYSGANDEMFPKERERSFKTAASAKGKKTPRGDGSGGAAAEYDASSAQQPCVDTQVHIERTLAHARIGHYSDLRPLFASNFEKLVTIPMHAKTFDSTRALMDENEEVLYGAFGVGDLVQPRLANFLRLEDALAKIGAARAAVRPKYDGERLQVHWYPDQDKAGNDVRTAHCFSRGVSTACSDGDRPLSCVGARRLVRSAEQCRSRRVAADADGDGARRRGTAGERNVHAGGGVGDNELGARSFAHGQVSASLTFKVFSFVSTLSPLSLTLISSVLLCAFICLFSL
jgi:hypothetical protein